MKIKGFTLIELLTTMLLFVILSTLAVSSYSYLFKQNEQQTIVNELKAAIHYAKIQAISLGTPLTLTSLDGTKNWSKGMLLGKFNRRTKKIERFYQWQWRHPGWELAWVGARSFEKIIFSNTPASAISNGHFTLINRDTNQKVVIILNRLGRLKIADPS